MTDGNGKTIALKLAVIAGLLMLIPRVGMLLVLPSSLAWMPDGFITPILALEFIPSRAVAEQMVGKDHTAIETLITGHYWDMAFLVAYGVFLASCCFALFEKGLSRNIALIFAFLAPVADIFENLQVLEVLKSFSEPSADIDYMKLRIAVVVKFGAIAIMQTRLLGNLWSLNKAGRLTVVVILTNAVATGAAFLNVKFAAEVMINTISICWLMLWVCMMLEVKALRSASLQRLS